jgi:hypothetical protein
MIIVSLAFALLFFIASMVAVLVGFIAWVVLKLMKEELHLDIKIK